MFERIKFENYEEWKKLRNKGIGGSDAPIILGLSQWKTNLDLWKEKTGVVVLEIEEKESDNEFIRYGKMAEDPLRRLFQAKMYGLIEVKTTDEVLVRKDKPYLRASLDAELLVLQDFLFASSDDRLVPLKQGMKGIYEGKTKFRPKGNEWKSSIPMNYFCQTIHYLLVTDFDFVIVNVELSYANSISVIKTFCFLKTEKIDDMIYLESEEDKFWGNVETKTEPSLKIDF